MSYLLKHLFRTLKINDVQIIQIKLEQIIKSFKILIKFLKLSVSYENTLDIYNNPYDSNYKIWPDENMAILKFIEDDTKEDDLESESEEEEENNESAL